MNTIRLIFPDINGAPRGKLIAKEHYDQKKQFAMPCLVLVDDIDGNEAPDATSFWVPEGDSDVLLIPDQSTFLAVPNNPDSQAQVIVDIQNQSGDEVPVAPRSVLKNVLKWYAENDIEIKIASELEFFIIDPKGEVGTFADSYEKPYADINSLDKYQEIVDEIIELTRTLGLSPETINKEDCQGQYEVTFGPTDALFMADRVLYFKQLVKDVLRRHNLQATFLAQPFGDLCGSGGHVHLSLWKDGKNLFDGKTDHLEQFVAGNILYMRDLSAIYAPNPNSYRRWNLWARGAKQPSWSEESRKDSAIRITDHGDFGKHIEVRVPGADVSSHLAYAAILAAGAEGIKNELTYKTKIVEEQTQLELPLSLSESLHMFTSGSAVDLLGEEFVKLFAAVKLNELKTFNKAISRWERDTYGIQV